MTTDRTPHDTAGLRLVTGIVIGTAALQLAVLGGTPADAASHTLAMTNVGSRALTVCEHFEDHGTGATTATTTRYCEGVHVLRQGMKSTKWAKDTDAVWLQGGYTLKVRKFGPDPTIRGCREHAFLTKVSPSPWDGTVDLYRTPCRKYGKK